MHQQFTLRNVMCTLYITDYHFYNLQHFLWVNQYNDIIETYVTSSVETKVLFITNSIWRINPHNKKQIVQCYIIQHQLTINLSLDTLIWEFSFKVVLYQQYLLLMESLCSNNECAIIYAAILQTFSAFRMLSENLVILLGSVALLYCILPSGWSLDSQDSTYLLF